MSYYNLGRVYSDKEEHDSALEWYGKSLAIHEEYYGTDHLRTPADLYHEIGFVHLKKNDTDKALDYYFKAMAIYENIAKEDNGIKPSLAATYNQIGVVYGKKGDIHTK